MKRYYYFLCIFVIKYLPIILLLCGHDAVIQYLDKGEVRESSRSGQQLTLLPLTLNPDNRHNNVVIY